MRAAYLFLMAWQVVWHGLLPPPLGSRSAALVILCTLPLLVPLRGVLRDSGRSRLWAGLLLLVYFMAGVTEAWSHADQRIPALVQVAMVVAYLLAFGSSARAGVTPGDGR